MTEPTPFTFLGRLLGTGEGWDYADESHWWIYHFQPAVGIQIPACDTLHIDTVNGTFTAQNQRSETIATLNIVKTLYVPES